jgi:hypothetical protein
VDLPAWGIVVIAVYSLLQIPAVVLVARYCEVDAEDLPTPPMRAHWRGSESDDDAPDATTTEARAESPSGPGAESPSGPGAGSTPGPGVELVPESREESEPEPARGGETGMGPPAGDGTSPNAAGASPRPGRDGASGRVRCRYCGAMNAPEFTRCRNCVEQL